MEFIFVTSTLIINQSINQSSIIIKQEFLYFAICIHAACNY